MKKITGLLIVFGLLLFPIVSFGVDNDEEAVELPNGEYAEDYFTNRRDDKWVYNESDNWIEYTNSGYLYNNYYGLSNEDFAYQSFDYNNLRSDKYRFIVTVGGGNTYTWSGFVINDNLSFSTDDDLAFSIVKNTDFWSEGKHKNQFQITFNDVISYETSNLINSYDTFEYEVILKRVNNTNLFNVELIVSNSSEEIFRVIKDNVLMNSIYPALWVEENKEGYFYSYEAYYVPNDTDTVIFNELYQDGDTMRFDWYAVDDEPEEVKLFFSSDENIDFINDTVIDISNSKDFSISDLMKEDGYFAIVGYEDGSYGVPSVKKFEYLEPVTNFTYVPTNKPNKYKFTWDAVEGAEKYKIDYGKVKWLKSNRLTMTIKNILDPSSVSILAKKESNVSPKDSISKTVEASNGNLHAVQNFNVVIVGDYAELSWSQYQEASSYILYRNNGLGELTALDPNPIITTTTFNDPLDSNFLRLNYNITAIVGGEESVMTETVSLGNKVKNLNAEFNDVTSQVEVTWYGIDQANKYRVYMSENEDMSEATTVEVDANSYAFDFEKNDKINKYIQVEAMYLDEETPSNNIYSDKTDVLTIDFSRNNAVSGIVPTYIANTYEVGLKWNELTGATAYNVLVGDSPANLSIVDTVVDESYTYRIKNTDKNKLYFSIQGVSASQNFVQSTPVSTVTFEKDHVENLSVNYNGDTKKAEVRWNSLLRAEKYSLTAGANSYEVTGNTTVLENIAIGTNFTVKGIKTEDSLAVYSLPSNVVTAVDVEYDIQIEPVSSIATKPYGQPIELELQVVVNKPGVDLNTVSLEFDLKNIFEPGTNDLIASYIYPEVMYVTVNGVDNVDYLTTVKSGQVVNGVMNADGGYTVKILFSDAVDNHIETGSNVVIMLKTDLRFDNLDGDSGDSILYRELSDPYAQMELPFHIEDQIERLETHYGYENDPFIQDEARVDVIFSYKTSTEASATTYTKYQLINYSFKDKELIIGE